MSNEVFWGKFSGLSSTAVGCSCSSDAMPVMVQTRNYSSGNRNLLIVTSHITVDAVRRREAEMLRDMQELVEFESPSSDKRAVDRLGELLAGRFQAMGAHVHLHNSHNFGNHLQADFPGRAQKPVLLLGHIDTVWDLGTLSKMPFRIADDR